MNIVSISDVKDNCIALSNITKNVIFILLEICKKLDELNNKILNYKKSKKNSESQGYEFYGV